MRRGLGASSIFREKDKDRVKQEYGNELRSKREADIANELETLKDKLRHFSAKFRSEISEDSKLCEAFLTICDLIDLDPLVSDKNIWEDIFGGGRFLPEVSLQLLAVCRDTRDENGGVLEISECTRRINRRRGGGKYANVTDKDVRRAVKELRCLSETGDERLLEIRKIGNKEVVVYAAMISDDVGNILAHLMTKGGRDDRKSLEKKFPGGGIDCLIRDGQVWLDGTDDSIFLPPNFS